MYDDDDDDSDNEDRDPYARECSSDLAMVNAVREYLMDPEQHGLTKEQADELLAKPEARKAISSGVMMRSYVYYVGERVAELKG